MACDCILRPAAADDLALLQHISSHARCRHAALPALAHVAAAPPLALSRFDPCRTIVAAEERDNAIVGFAMTRPLDDALYLDHISVLPSASGRGIGAALLMEALSQARATQQTSVTLTTFRHPPWNGPWFQRHGFTVMPPHCIGPGLAAVIARQERTLDPMTRQTLWLAV